MFCFAFFFFCLSHFGCMFVSSAMKRIISGLYVLILALICYTLQTSAIDWHILPNKNKNRDIDYMARILHSLMIVRWWTETQRSSWSIWQASGLSSVIWLGIFLSSKSSFEYDPKWCSEGLKLLSLALWMWWDIMQFPWNTRRSYYLV